MARDDCGVATIEYGGRRLLVADLSLWHSLIRTVAILPIQWRSLRLWPHVSIWWLTSDRLFFLRGSCLVWLFFSRAGTRWWLDRFPSDSPKVARLLCDSGKTHYLQWPVRSSQWRYLQRDSVIVWRLLVLWWLLVHLWLYRSIPFTPVFRKITKLLVFFI